MPALIFDCDGVLADTERHGHLPAFNKTFDHFGLPVRWSDADYAHKLRIGGGKERLRTLLTPDFVAAAELPEDPGAQQRAVEQWHRCKTEFFTRMIADGAVPARPGIARLASQAAAAGWQLAVASTSAEVSVRSVLHHVMGPALASRFAVFAGDVVATKKPAPDIYLLAIETLKVEPADVVVIEDSSNGLRAALSAGLRCVVTVSTYTRDEDFIGAALVVSSLGNLAEGTGETTKVLADPYGLAPADVISIADLHAVLDRSPVPVPPRGA